MQKTRGSLRRHAALALALGLGLTLGACGEAEPVNPDAGPDGGSTDSGPDPDSAAPDGSAPDATAPDAGPDAGPGSTCGGLGGAQCSIGFFCYYTLAEQCGAADQTGICTAISDDCPAVEDPVCGCDGETYSNSCVANAAGVSVAASGACDERRCGGKVAPGTNNSCEADEYCDWKSNGCGFDDGQGVCRPRPENCDTLAQPVCGCDGQTYGNACSAALVGVDVYTEGECPTQGKSCGGKVAPGTDNTCAETEFCSYTLEDICGAADAPGTCQPRPQACPLAGGAVCGCDNQTYLSECDANVAGISVQRDGACDA